jgi:hypothetical protein
MERLLSDTTLAAAQARAGLARAAAFTWADTARRLRTAYLDALTRRHARVSASEPHAARA